MNQFEQNNLSPLPVAPTPCSLPYGLTWEDLKPLLPGFISATHNAAQVFITYQKQGLNGGENSTIITIRYLLGVYDQREQTLFIKRIDDPRTTEARKYQFLASHGIPAPRLLANLPSGQGEIILLEFLPTIGIDFKSVEAVNSLVHRIADINSLAAPPEIFPPQPGMPQDQFDALVWSALTALERLTTTTGEPFPVDAARWFQTYRTANQKVQQYPLALNHNELYFQQVGWAQRGSDRELVVFDLETMAPAPRFHDIAGILYPLSLYTGRDQAGLFQIYLDRLSSRTQHHQRFDAAVEELRFTRIKSLCDSLPWLVEWSQQPAPASGREALELTTRAITADLAALSL